MHGRENATAFDASRSRNPRRARTFALRLAAAAMAAAIGAGGLQAQKKTELAPVEGLENWKYGLDLSEYPPGKYNLVVEGRDKAGNVTQAPPMNIFVDPESDKPRVSVVNPIQGMRVGGDLNIVGTCVDDDGVGSVEISLDGGEFVQAEGGEFWFLYLQTGELPEGHRVLDIRGVDINGLEGPTVRVAFELDRTKPAVTVSNPPTGSLVSGAFNLAGSVFDANEVRSLEISEDDQATWKKVNLIKGRDPLQPSFSWPIDTRKFPDGPKVFSFRSVDGVGSKSTSAYLLFIDNTKPVIEVVRPSADQAVNGRFSVAGAVRDTIGVKRLSYVFGGTESGEIALTRGDPYFIKEFDAAALKGDKAEVILEAEDTIGNIVRQTVSRRIDWEGDKPVLAVTKPEAGATLREGEPLWGSISDDDGVAAFRWSLDGGAASEVACSEVWSLPLPAASPGKHVLTLTAVDVNGLAGRPVSFPFVLDKGPGAVAFERLASAKESRSFAQGIVARVDGGESLEGAVTAPNPLVSLSYAVAGGDPVAIALGKGEASGSIRFKIPVDRQFPYGFAPVEISAADAMGNEFRGVALLYIADYSVAREDLGFRFRDGRLSQDGRFAFGAPADGAAPDSRAAPLRGAFYREELASLRLEPFTDLVEASFEGRIVSIASMKDGVTASTTLVGTTLRGHEVTAGPFVFVTDATPPELSIESPESGTLFSGALEIRGRAVDAGGAVELSLRALPDGERRAVPVAEDGGFVAELSAVDFPSGPLNLEFEAKDAAGNLSRAYLCLGADASPPEIRFLSPEPGAPVWGVEGIAALVADASGIASVEFAADGETFAPIPWTDRYFVHLADLAANPAAAYRVTDLAGNVATARPEISVEPAPVRVPAASEIAYEPAEGEARVDLAGTSGPRKATLLMPGLTEADFAASALADPSADPKVPPERFPTRLLLSGALALKGQATVPGQAKAVSVSYDGGATYLPLASVKDPKAAKQTLAFSLSVEAAKIPAGQLRWLLKIEDFSGAVFYCPIYGYSDNAAPKVSVLYPDAGSLAQTGPFPLVVRAEDAEGIASAEVSIGAAKTAADISTFNRYLVVDVDAWEEAKGAPLTLAVAAKDAAGNQGSASAKATLNAAGDLPAVSIAATDAVLGPGAVVFGTARDDDAVPAISVSIDGAEVATFSSGSFAVKLDALAVGRHSLSVAATDPNGKSSSAKKDFSFSGPKPSLGEISVGDASGAQPYAPGLEIPLAPPQALSFEASAQNGLASVEYSINGGAFAKAVAGKTASGKAPAPGEAVPYSIPIPATLPFDRFAVDIVAKDALGMTSAYALELHAVLPTQAGRDVEDAIRFEDARIAPADQGYAFDLSPGDSLVGLFNGRPIKSVALSAPIEGIEASFEGSAVILTAKAEGLPGPASIVLETVDGDAFEWGPFAARIDAARPSLRVDTPTDHQWVTGSVDISGFASDANGVASIQVSVNGGPRLAVGSEVEGSVEAAPEGAATAPPEPPAAEAGPAAPESPALPETGTAPAEAAPIEAAPTEVAPTEAAPTEAAPIEAAPTEAAPTEAAPTETAPTGGEPPAGTTRAADPSIREIAYALTPLVAEETSGASILRDVQFQFTLPLATAPDGATRIDIFVRDATGKETSVVRYINKDTLPPEVSMVIPGPGESVNGTMTAIGEARDGGRLASLIYLPGYGAPEEEVDGLGTFSRTFDFARESMPLPEGAGFMATDKAGNASIMAPDLVVDVEKDKPIAEIHAPSEMEVMRGDFSISGVAYDDDGLAAAYYRIDWGDWTRIEMQGTSFTLPIVLKETTDNEHLVEVRAEDIYGVQGDIVSRRYRISKEEPRALMTEPSIAKPVKGVVDIVGEASDANGIGAVSVSVDNRTSYDVPVGTDSWRLRLDTPTLMDGLHAIAVKPMDNYETEGFYATMIAIDNTFPKAYLDLPFDGSDVAKSMSVSGRVSDNVKLDSVWLEIAPIAAAEPPVLVLDLGIDPIVQLEVDVSSLVPGPYVVRLIAKDRADNQVTASVSVFVKGSLPEDRVDIHFPLEGSILSGKFKVQGRAQLASGAGTVTILADGEELGTTEADARGWFSYDIVREGLVDGPHVIAAKAVAEDGRVVASRDARIEWTTMGPWIAIESFQAGDYLPYRPFLKGSAGIEAEYPDPEDKAAVDAYKKSAKSRIPTLVDVSLDDGRTFEAASGTSEWSFRLETLDYPEGDIHVIVRATFPDGSFALAKTLLFLDKTPPTLRIITPAEGGRFNGVLSLSGTSMDDLGMQFVGVALRKGDKASYQVPSFIQGIYLDAHFLGSTIWETAVGLTFFDDNVKLQGHIGQAPETDENGDQQSFYGNVFGAKLIANLGLLPFNSLFGPDWDFLSASFGLGANFTYFTKTQAGSGLLVGAVFGQIEFPKVTLKNVPIFRKYSFYTEAQVWVLSSVVSGGFIPRMSFGVRVGVF